MALTLQLPDYAPPNAQRASMAVGLAPLIVLVTFTLLVSHAIDADTAFATFLACTIWVTHEMNDFQRCIDGYNAEYVRRHLEWRSSEALQALAQRDDTTAATRAFVMRFIGSGRVLLLDGALP